MKTVKKAKNFYKKKTEKKEEPIRYTAQYKIGRSTELLEFLLQKQGRDMSRNSIKSLLSQHKVLVNGKVVSQFDYPLAKDDEVKILYYDLELSPTKGYVWSRFKQFLNNDQILSEFFLLTHSYAWNDGEVQGLRLTGREALEENDECIVEDGVF